MDMLTQHQRAGCKLPPEIILMVLEFLAVDFLPHRTEEFFNLVRVSHMMNQLAVPLLYREVELNDKQQSNSYFKQPNVVSYSYTRKITIYPGDSNTSEVQQLATRLNDRILKHLRNSNPQGDATDATLKDNFFRNRITLLMYDRIALGFSAGIAFPIRELVLPYGDNCVIPDDVHLLPHLESIRAGRDLEDFLQKFLKLRESANMKPIETLTWQDDVSRMNMVTRSKISSRCNAFVGVKKHVLEFSSDPHCFCGPDRSSTFHPKLSLASCAGPCTATTPREIVDLLFNAVMRDLPIEELSVYMIDELSALLGFKVQQSVLEAMHWTELEGILDRFYETLYL